LKNGVETEAMWLADYGAHHFPAQIHYGLNDVGFTLAPNAIARKENSNASQIESTAKSRRGSPVG
jgi:hypothetical protein